MRRTACAFLGLIMGVTVTATSLTAHHSFAAQFDGSKLLMLKGTVTKVEWRNPHIWVYFDVKDTDGTVTPWECEGQAPNALTRLGWGRDDLKTGEVLEVEGYPARDGTNTCNARTWKLANGKTIFDRNTGPSQ